VKISDDGSGRLFPTTTKLTTFTETEAGRLRDVGDRDTAERSSEGSLTDQINSPFDGICTLPEIFNLVEGLIFHPDPDKDDDNTSNITTGDWGSRRVNVTTFSHLRLSSTLIAFPLIMILKTSPELAADDEEELTVTNNREKEVRGEKVREAQSLW
jgi:hypothetical protein